jgi:hypothetical protein
MNVLDLYSTADYVLARVARFLPDPLVRGIQRRISRRVLKRLSVPPAWLAEGPDGFQPEDEIDLVFGYGHPNPVRVGCLSEAELMELATRRRLIDDPRYDHFENCSPCCRRLRVLQRRHVR